MFYLRDYQSQALEFCLKTPRAYLAAKAGAGKTAVALAYAAELNVPVLVVCPKRVVPQWAIEAKKWAFSEGFTFREYVGTPATRKSILGTKAFVTVVSFEFFTELVGLSKPWEYGLVVFDEASRLRNGGRKGSLAWKTMAAISTKTQSRILLMSGSPRSNSAHELFAPVALLDQGERLGRTLTGFRGKFMEPDKVNRYTQQVYSWRLRQGMESVLYSKIKDLYFAVSPNLGLESLTVDRMVELSPYAKGLYSELKADKVIDAEDLELTATSEGVVANKLHQITQGAVFDDDHQVVEVHTEKLDELAELIEEIDAPVMVCIWYTHDKQRIMQRFKNAVDITTTAGLSLAKQGQVDIAVLHPQSAGHGIDGLQNHFSNVIWFALPHSFELYDQANKRIVRSGQRETVTIYRIVGRATIDEQILQRLARKEREQDEFIRIIGG